MAPHQADQRVSLVEFCLLTGIPRDAHRFVNSWYHMFKAVNKLQLLRSLSTKGPLYILSTALQLKRQMKQYPYWVESIRRRYLHNQPSSFDPTSPIA